MLEDIYGIFHNHRLARKSTVKRFLRRTKIKIRKYESNKIEFEKLMESFNSWKAYMDYANTHNLKMSLFSKYFKNVM